MHSGETLGGITSLPNKLHVTRYRSADLSVTWVTEFAVR